MSRKLAVLLREECRFDDGRKWEVSGGMNVRRTGAQRLVVGLCFLAAAVGCGETEPTGFDGGQPADAQVAMDAGRTDGGRGDGGVMPDAGGSEVDAGPAMDGGSDPDGGVEPDGGVAFDGGVAPDGGMTPDAGSVVRSCFDGILSGDESDVDCGGSCAPCTGRLVCRNDDDCEARCVSGACTGPRVYLREGFEFDEPAIVSALSLRKRVDFGDTDWGTADLSDIPPGWSSWEIGEPQGEYLTEAASGRYAAVTNLDGRGTLYEHGALVSPEFDFSALTTDPILQFSLFLSHSNTDDDAFYVTVSTDGGATFSRIDADPVFSENWQRTWNYREHQRLHWHRVSTAVDGLAGQASVIFHFVYRRLGFDSGYGAGIDDVEVLENLCGNGVLDPDEAAVDCGGSCAPCPGGTACTSGGDCDSGNCAGGSCGAPLESCSAIRRGDLSVPSGTYSIQPLAAGDVYRVYCDMETDGGGWTLVTSTGYDLSPYRGDYSAELEDLSRSSFSSWLWDGLLPEVGSDSDIRFACRRDREEFAFDVSYYDNDWYPHAAASSSVDTCFGAAGGDFVRSSARRDNLTGAYRAAGTGDGGGWCSRDGASLTFDGDSDSAWSGNRCGSAYRGSSRSPGHYYVFVRDNLCGNGVLDTGEVAIDCGGTCQPCPDTTPCTDSSECRGRCEMGMCTSCEDGLLNGSETAIDCGGDCAPCADGGMCIADDDCGGTCGAGGLCRSCNDGAQNGSETSVDCGGECDECALGHTCISDDDCLSRRCDANTCAAVPRSCTEILADDPMAADGVYLVQPNPSRPARMVLCDMTTNGGGWTLIASSKRTNIEHRVGGYHANLQTLSPQVAHEPLWEDFLSIGNGYGDIRFACRESGDAGMDVDRSYFGTAMLNGAANGTSPTVPVSGGWDNVAGTPIAAGDLRFPHEHRCTSSFTTHGSWFAWAREGSDLGVRIERDESSCAAAHIIVEHLAGEGVGSFDVHYTVDGVPSMQTVSAGLAPGEQWSVEVAAGMIEAEVISSEDHEPGNNSATVNTDVVAPGLLDMTLWRPGGINSSWDYGDSFAPRPNFEMRTAWATNRRGRHNVGERSYLMSPCIDASGFGEDPTLVVYVARDRRASGGSWVEVSLDGGASWSRVLARGDSDGWYDDPINQWWDEYMDYHTSSRTEVDVMGASTVRFRVMFDAGAIQNDGIAVSWAALN